MNKILGLSILLFLTACATCGGRPPCTTSKTYVTPTEVTTTTCTVPVAQTTTVTTRTY